MDELIPFAAVDNSAKDKKILVVGSLGYSHVTCVSWADANDVNLVDFDIVVVDARSMTDDDIKRLSFKLGNIREKLARLMRSGGEVIVMGARDRVVNTSQTSFDLYSWSPIPIYTIGEKGDTVVRDHKFAPKLLSKLRSWNYFYDPRGMTPELAGVFGKGAKVDWTWDIKVILANRYGKLLAASITMTAATTTEVYQFGRFILLPCIDEVSPQEAVTLLLEDLLRRPQKTPPPVWIEALPVPGLPELDREIDAIATQIVLLEHKSHELQEQRQSIADYRKLLFASGRELEDIFARCLEELGGEIRDAKYSEEEFVLIYDDKIFLVECKGVNKSISLTHFRQISDYVLKFEEDTGNAGKGILFGNAWRELPLTERDTADTAIFPGNVIARAVSVGVALVGSGMFFAAFCAVQEGKLAPKALLDAITGQSGVVRLPE